MGLTEWAYSLSEPLLSDPLPRRWAHSPGEQEAIPILVWDNGDAAGAGGSRYEEQARLWPRRNTKVEYVDLVDLQAAYARIEQHVASLVRTQEPRQSGWAVSEITVRLGISAKGGLAFVAEAGIEAAIELKFAGPGSR